MSKLYTLEEAANLVKDGDTIWINSFSAIASPVDLNKAMTTRFRETGTPKHLSVYSPFSFSDHEQCDRGLQSPGRCNEPYDKSSCKGFVLS